MKQHCVDEKNHMECENSRDLNEDKAPSGRFHK